MHTRKFIPYNNTNPFLISCHNIYFICDLIGSPDHFSPSRTSSGTPVLRRIGFCCHHSPRTQTVCIRLSEGGSTTAGRILNRRPPTSAPGSGLLLELHARWETGLNRLKSLCVSHIPGDEYAAKMFQVVQGVGSIMSCYIFPSWWNPSLSKYNMYGRHLMPVVCGVCCKAIIKKGCQDSRGYCSSRSQPVALKC